MGIFENGSRAAVVDAAAFFDSDVPQRLGRLVGLGVLVAIGTTRDRGALSIQITQDGDWTREYFRRSDEAVEWLDYWADVIEKNFSSEPVEAATSPKPRRGRRIPT